MDDGRGRKKRCPRQRKVYRLLLEDWIQSGIGKCLLFSPIGLLVDQNSVIRLDS